MIKEFDHLFKLVIVGNQGVGKSSIFLRFADDSFVDNYLATIGVDFRFKTIQIDNTLCKLQIWDTAGQERFRTITSAYYRGSQAVIIVFDVTNEESYKEVEDYWLNEVKTNADRDIQIILVGSKSDLEFAVNTEEVKSLADSLGISVFYASAKTGDGVMELFSELTKSLIKKSTVRRASQIENKTSLNAQEKTKAKKCCG